MSLTRDFICALADRIERGEHETAALDGLREELGIVGEPMSQALRVDEVGAA